MFEQSISQNSVNHRIFYWFWKIHSDSENLLDSCQVLVRIKSYDSSNSLITKFEYFFGLTAFDLSAVEGKRKRPNFKFSTICNTIDRQTRQAQNTFLNSLSFQSIIYNLLTKIWSKPTKNKHWRPLVYEMKGKNLGRSSQKSLFWPNQFGAYSSTDSKFFLNTVLILF